MGSRSQTRKVGAAGNERKPVEVERERRWKDKNRKRENARAKQENK